MTRAHIQPNMLEPESEELEIEEEPGACSQTFYQKLHRIIASQLYVHIHLEYVHELRWSCPKYFETRGHMVYITLLFYITLYIHSDLFRQPGILGKLLTLKEPLWVPIVIQTLLKTDVHPQCITLPWISPESVSVLVLQVGESWLGKYGKILILAQAELRPYCNIHGAR